jgi:hypothetical protein
MRREIWLSIVLALVAIGCGGSLPPPNEQMMKSREAISKADGQAQQAAEALGNDTVPAATLHLKMAKDQIATAEALIADGDMENADLVLKRAEADAELAESLSREAVLKKQVAAAKKQIDSLNEK